MNPQKEIQEYLKSNRSVKIDPKFSQDPDFKNSQAKFHGVDPQPENQLEQNWKNFYGNNSNVNSNRMQQKSALAKSGS